MWALCKKELRQFFSSLTGYIAISVFLIVNGLVLFVFPDNVFDFGYATLEKFFQLAPWILLLLIPAVCMRSFSEEFRSGTFEILATRPLTRWQMVMGKFLGNYLVALIALLPTIVYIFCIQELAADQGLDVGATAGAYVGLFFLAAVFTAISTASSSFTANPVVAFIMAMAACALIYYGLNAISKMLNFSGGADYLVEMLGIDFHYRSISRGLIDVRDIFYFLSVVALSLFITYRNLMNR
ncbi:MAG: ABC transporter permease subunit [Chitinophagaceae bacterium]|nr:ABC transporter permease subunit [Chitinophagaceae bacterium]